MGSGVVYGDLPGRKHEAAKEMSQLQLEAFSGSAATSSY